MNLGRILLRAYASSLLWFTIGVIAGGIYVAAILIAHGVLR